MSTVQDTAQKSPDYSKPLPEPFATSHIESYPEVHRHSWDAPIYIPPPPQYGNAYEIDSNLREKGGEDALEDKPKILGIDRRAFFIGVVLIGVIVIAGVVGGVVGSVLKQQADGNNVQESTGSLAAPVAATPPPMPSMAATQIEDAYFLVAQNATGEIVLYSWHDDPEYRDAMRAKLNLTDLPVRNTPMALSGWRDKDAEVYELQLGYAAESTPGLIYATFTCNVSDFQCSPPSTRDLGIYQRAPSPGAGLAILTEKSHDTVYSVGSNGSVYRVFSVIDQWNPAKVISGKAKAHPTSPIATFKVNGSKWVFWFNEQRQLQAVKNSEYENDNLSDGWSDAEIIPAITPEDMPRAMVAVGDNSSTPHQLLYFSGREILRIQGDGDGQWTSSTLNEPGTNNQLRLSDMSNGPLATIGIGDRDEGNTTVWFSDTGALQSYTKNTKRMVGWYPGAKLEEA